MARVRLIEGNSPEEKCSGCRTCEAVCALAHEAEGLFHPHRARLRVEPLPDEGFRLRVCLHCPRPRCVAACPTGALSRVEGRVTIDCRLCNRCGLCRPACPYGALFLDPSGLPLLCDLCGGSPHCVACCPQGVLHFK